MRLKRFVPGISVRVVVIGVAALMVLASVLLVLRFLPGSGASLS